MLPDRGFTLIELMVAISIIAVLATVGFTYYQKAQSTARDSKRIADSQEVSKALEQFKALNNTYSIATTLPCNTGSWWDFSSALWGTNGNQVGCPASLSNGLNGYFTSTIPNDPLCPAGVCAGSWRNYVVSEPSNGSSYIIYVKLENSPSNNNCPSGVTPPAPYNYCQPSQQ